MVTGGTLFEELGFYYVGPIDGHNLEHLIPVLENVRDTKNGPILVHVVTKKGKGYAPAEASADKYHGVSKFNVLTGEQKKIQPEGGAVPDRVWRIVDRRGEKRSHHRGDHRRHAIRHRCRSLCQGLPGSHLRRRHRRTARRDVSLRGSPPTG